MYYLINQPRTNCKKLLSIDLLCGQQLEFDFCEIKTKIIFKFATLLKCFQIWVKRFICMLKSNAAQEKISTDLSHFKSGRN